MRVLVAASAVLFVAPALGQNRPDDAVVITAGKDVGTLTVPSTEQATKNIQRTPGGVEVVPDTAFKEGRADTLQDVLAYVPGVFSSQARYGDDVRVSIRGSGLSRPYGNRGVNMFMDGVPINTSDGLVDLFEIDPSAYHYVEVFKGANAMRYGANSLGGAINFVTPTGYDASPLEARVDAGSFGYTREQASTGGAIGNLDGFVTGSFQSSEHYRDHTEGNQERISANIGYRFSPDAETRFYLNLNSIRDHMAGELTEDAALHAPRTANADFLWKDQQRNIDSGRIANKTTLRFGPTTLEFGLFGVYRHVDHPNYLYLDYTVSDYGGFVRASDDRMIGDFHNTLVAGAYLQNGTLDSHNYSYANTYPFGAYPAGVIPGTAPGAVKGSLLSVTIDRPKNASVYVDETFFLRPDLEVTAGTQVQHAVRPRENLSDESQSGSLTFNNVSPAVRQLRYVAHLVRSVRRVLVPLRVLRTNRLPTSPPGVAATLSRVGVSMVNRFRNRGIGGISGRDRHSGRTPSADRGRGGPRELSVVPLAESPTTRECS